MFISLIFCSTDFKNSVIVINLLSVADPSPPQLSVIGDKCDSSGGSYMAMLTFNDDETSRANIVSYEGNLFGETFSVSFTTNTSTVNITGLNCSTTYNISATAKNCVNVSSNENLVSFKTPLPGELYYLQSHVQYMYTCTDPCL